MLHCVDCKHSLAHPQIPLRCMLKTLDNSGSYFMVYGKQPPVSFVGCESMRLYGECGKDAKLWEAKS